MFRGSFLLFFLSFFLVITAEENNETTIQPSQTSNYTCRQGHGQKCYHPEDFSRLQLKEEHLLGSRWSLEQKTVVDVYHSIEIMDVTLINNNEITLRIEFNLGQFWHAEDLQFPSGLFKPEDPNNTWITVNEQVLDNMWSPDAYIATSRESNMNTVGTPLSLVRIRKDSKIVFRVRMYTKVGCSSSFEWFPLDIQSCNLTIESYKYPLTIVNYHWSREDIYRPIVMGIRRLFQYDLKLPLEFNNGSVSRGGLGIKYPFVRVNFRFERRLGNSIVQVYTPTVLVVVLSWFSFWLGLDAVPGRIGLLVTCMLTMVTMHNGVQSSIPPVHYITMMDIWYVCCMGFVFAAMSEFVIVKYFHWRYVLKGKAEEKRYQAETREKLYNIMQLQQQKVNEPNYCPVKARSFNIINEGLGGGVMHVASLDKPTTALASAYWSTPQEHLMNGTFKELEQNNILQSIVVGGLSSNSLGIGSPGDEEGFGSAYGETIGEKVAVGNEGTEGVPVWVSMDRFCRGFLPFLFACFNTIYWPVLYLGSAAQDTN